MSFFGRWSDLTGSTGDPSSTEAYPTGHKNQLLSVCRLYLRDNKEIQDDIKEGILKRAKELYPEPMVETEDNTKYFLKKYCNYLVNPDTNASDEEKRIMGATNPFGFTGVPSASSTGYPHPSTGALMGSTGVSSLNTTVPFTGEEDVVLRKGFLYKKDVTEDYGTFLQHLNIFPESCTQKIPLITSDIKDYMTRLVIADCYKDFNVILDKTNTSKVVTPQEAPKGKKRKERVNEEETAPAETPADIRKRFFFDIIGNHFDLFKIYKDPRNEYYITGLNIFYITHPVKEGRTLRITDEPDWYGQLHNIQDNTYIISELTTEINKYFTSGSQKRRQLYYTANLPLTKTDRSNRFKNIRKAFAIYDNGQNPKELFCKDTYKILITPGTLIDAASKNLTNENVISFLPKVDEIEIINQRLNNKGLLASYGLENIICNLELKSFSIKDPNSKYWKGSFGFNVNSSITPDVLSFMEKQYNSIRPYYKESGLTDEKKTNIAKVEKEVKLYGNRVEGLFTYEYNDSKIETSLGIIGRKNVVSEKDRIEQRKNAINDPNHVYFLGNSEKNHYISRILNKNKLLSGADNNPIKEFMVMIKYAVTKLLGDVLQVMYVDLLLGQDVPGFATINRKNVFILSNDNSVISNALLHNYNVIDNDTNPTMYYRADAVDDVNIISDDNLDQIVCIKEDEEEGGEIPATTGGASAVYAYNEGPASLADTLTYNNMIINNILIGANALMKKDTNNILKYNIMLYIRLCLIKINEAIDIIFTSIPDTNPNKNIYVSRFKFSNPFVVIDGTVSIDETVNYLLAEIQEDTREIVSASSTASATIIVPSLKIEYSDEIIIKEIQQDKYIELNEKNYPSTIYKDALFSTGNMYPNNLDWFNKLYLLKFSELFQACNIPDESLKINLFLKYIRCFDICYNNDRKTNIFLKMFNDKIGKEYRTELFEFQPILDYTNLDFKTTIFKSNGSLIDPTRVREYNIIFNANEQENNVNASIIMIKSVTEIERNIENNNDENKYIKSIEYNGNLVLPLSVYDLTESTMRKRTRPTVSPTINSFAMTNENTTKPAGKPPKGKTGPKSKSGKKKGGAYNIEEQSGGSIKDYNYNLYETYASTIPGFYTFYVFMNYPRLLFMAYSILRYITMMPLYKNSVDKTINEYHNKLLHTIKFFYTKEFSSKILYIFEKHDSPSYELFTNNNTYNETKEMMKVYDTLMYQYTHIAYSIMKKYNIIYEANEQLFIILEKIVSQKKVDVKLDVYNSIFEKDENKKMLIENFYDHMFKQNNIIVQAGHFEKVNVFEYIENGITKGRYGESMGPGIGETIKESALKGMSSKTEERSKLNDVWKTLKSKIVGIRSKPTLLSPILETNEANTNNGEKSSSAVVKPVENAVVKPDESAMVKPVETAMAQVSLKPKGPVVLSKRSAMRIPKSTQRRPERRPERTPGSRASAAAGGGLRIRRTRKKRTIKA